MPWIYVGASLVVILTASCLAGCEIENAKGMKAEELFTDPKVLELVLAAEKGDVKKIDALVAQGVDVNALGRGEVAPILRPLWKHNWDGYQALLRHGANVNAIDFRGESAIMDAAWEPSSSKWLKAALEHGGDPNQLNTRNPYFRNITPLFAAVYSINIENVKLVLAAGGKVDHRDAEQQTPFLVAASFAWGEIACTLLDAGADFSVKDSEGHDAAYYYTRRSRKENSDQSINDWNIKLVDRLNAKGMKIRFAD